MANFILNIFEIIAFDLRTKISDIGQKLRGNHFNSGKMDENYSFYIFETCASHLYSSKSHSQLLSLPDNGFGK